MVLTIDPARALVRALGLTSLGGEQRVAASALAAAGLAPAGVLTAGMLDQQQAWDAFVTRHAPTAEVARTLLDNAFYRQLSRSFSGAAEYVAVEEMCRLAESREHDLVVLDTPPASGALDFLRAPERIDRLLERRGALASLGRGAWRSMDAGARFVLRRLERATGGSTLRDISTFLVALDTMAGAALARSRRARALLRGGQAAFVLVARPRALILDETLELAARLRDREAGLDAVVVNRVHAPPTVPLAIADAAFAELERRASEPAAWLRDRWDDALAEAAGERALVARLAAAVPGVPVATIAEADHDVHSLGDLAAIARELGHQPTAATNSPVATINPPAAESP
jgi:anion-transporting  ArsA/GET3 family ATPase